MLLAQDPTGRRGTSQPAATSEDIERLKKQAQEKEAELERLRKELAEKRAAAESAKKDKPQPGEDSSRPEQRQRSFFTPGGF